MKRVEQNHGSFYKSQNVQLVKDFQTAPKNERHNVQQRRSNSFPLCLQAHKEKIINYPSKWPKNY